MLVHPEGENLIFIGLFVDISRRPLQPFVQFFEPGAGIPGELVRRRIVLCKVVKLDYLAEFLDEYFEQVLLLTPAPLRSWEQEASRRKMGGRRG